MTPSARPTDDRAPRESGGRAGLVAGRMSCLQHNNQPIMMCKVQCRLSHCICRLMIIDILTISGPIKKSMLHGELALDGKKGGAYNCTTFTMQ